MFGPLREIISHREKLKYGLAKKPEFWPGIKMLRSDTAT
jgi:hypothetical protein